MKPALVFFGIVFALSAAYAEEKNLISNFERVRRIDKPFTIGERGRVVVPSDVFGQARNFPNDLRILAASGTQWPFFLYVPPATVERETVTPEILNRSWVSGREAYLQFDLVVPQSAGKPPVHSQVELTTSDHDFIRRVEVFAEAENGRMAVGHLIDFSGQRGAQNQIIRYPVSDLTRLHIRIYSNAQNADETFTLSSVKLRRRMVGTVARETISTTKLDVPERETEAGAQTRMFDLGAENRPLEWVVFNVESSSYARSVSAYGRNKTYEPWKWIGGGEIHALEGDIQAEVKLHHARHRYIKLHIFHHDDQPLKIQSIRLEAIPRYLVFEAASEGMAGLYYRAWDLSPPRYDLTGRVESESIAELPVFQTTDAIINEAVNAPPWRKHSKFFGFLAVGAVSLLVVGIIASMLKKQKETN